LFAWFVDFNVGVSDTSVKPGTHPLRPCRAWWLGHWAGDPTYYEGHAPAVYGQCVPPGCY